MMSLRRRHNLFSSDPFYANTTFATPTRLKCQRKKVHHHCTNTPRQVAIAGYPNMGNNMSVVAAKQLLDLLAEDSDKADNFRRFVMDQSTTYFGESDDWWVSLVCYMLTCPTTDRDRMMKIGLHIQQTQEGLKVPRFPATLEEVYRRLNASNCLDVQVGRFFQYGSFF